MNIIRVTFLHKADKSKHPYHVYVHSDNHLKAEKAATLEFMKDIKKYQQYKLFCSANIRIIELDIISKMA